LVAGLVAKSLGATSPLPGVRHIEKDFELKHFSPTLEEVGYAVTWARKPPGLHNLTARQDPRRGTRPPTHVKAPATTA
jgi:hypothetical protein